MALEMTRYHFKGWTRCLNVVMDLLFFRLYILWHVQIMNKNIFYYNFFLFFLNVCEIRLYYISAIYYMFLLDTQCTTSCIENGNVTRANNHFTIASLVTLAHIVSERQRVSILVWAWALRFLLRRVKNI